VSAEILIHSRGLTRLPDEIWQHAEIRVLDAGHNQIADVPALPSVTDFLYLHDNLIRSIPFTNLERLKYLNLGDNLLDPLTDDIAALRAIEELRFENSGLTALPDAIGSLGALIELALRGNALTALPDSMRKLEQLTHLDLRGNHFATLPEVLAELPRLAKLDLRWNHALALPPWVTALRARGCRVLF